MVRVGDASVCQQTEVARHCLRRAHAGEVVGQLRDMLLAALHVLHDLGLPHLDGGICLGVVARSQEMLVEHRVVSLDGDLRIGSETHLVALLRQRWVLRKPITVYDSDDARAHGIWTHTK